MDTLLLALFFAIALLYSAVGHGGASSFLALMSIVGISALVMRPAALTLNILVASISALSFVFAKRLPASCAKPLVPLCVSGVICAYLGAQITLPITLFELLLAAFLLLSSASLALPKRHRAEQTLGLRQLSLATAIALGASLGFLAGLTGIGGGVLLSPILVLGRFAEVRASAAMAAIFIVLNSLSGVVALVLQGRYVLPDQIASWLLAAAVGGVLGAYLGSRLLVPEWLKRLLAIVLLLAAARVLTA